MVDHNKPFYSSWGAMIRSHYLEAPMWAHCPCGAFRSRGVCFKGDGVKAAKTSGMKLLSPDFACEIQGMINRHSLVEWDGMGVRVEIIVCGVELYLCVRNFKRTATIMQGLLITIDLFFSGQHQHFPFLKNSIICWPTFVFGDQPLFLRLSFSPFSI